MQNKKKIYYKDYETDTKVMHWLVKQVKLKNNLLKKET